jgi:hypothetical protein
MSTCNVRKRRETVKEKVVGMMSLWCPRGRLDLAESRQGYTADSRRLATSLIAER